jgi:hypothetical protein
MIFVCCVLFAACSPGKYMTYENFNEVPIGESIANVQTLVGRPYEVKELSSEQTAYIYIERVPIGDMRELFRRYTLIVEHGKVIDKTVKEESPLPIQFYG